MDHPSCPHYSRVMHGTPYLAPTPVEEKLNIVNASLQGRPKTTPKKPARKRLQLGVDNTWEGRQET